MSHAAPLAKRQHDLDVFAAEQASDLPQVTPVAREPTTRLTGRC
jgi:hypothetical protein